MTTPHPETVPLGDLDTARQFVLSVEASEEAKREIERKLDEYRERIQVVSEKWGTLTLHGQPVEFISKILMYSRDKEELKRLSKGLDRVADLVGAHDKLLARSELIKLAKDDPNFFVWAFGSFEDEIDRELLKLTVDEID